MQRRHVFNNQFTLVASKESLILGKKTRLKFETCHRQWRMEIIIILGVNKPNEAGIVLERSQMTETNENI